MRATPRAQRVASLPHKFSISRPHTSPPQAAGERRQLHFRLLIPAARAGAVIGRGGEAIAALKAVTGARIGVDRALPGCDERLVHIEAPDE